MTNNHIIDRGSRKSARLPVSFNDNLPATEIQRPFYPWQEKEEINLHDYLDVIVRRKWLIIMFLVLVFLSTLIFTLTSTKIYKAKAVVEVNQASPQVTKFEEMLGSEVKAREFYETQVELIGSKTLIGRTIDKLNLIEHPVLVSSADGVGTKLKLAFMSGRHDTVGQDLVNHCVNDILVQGARPLFFMDYLATGVLDEGVVPEVVGGVSLACRQNGCALLGGETAQMPDFYQPGEYDLAGFIVGLVERDQVLDGSAIRKEFQQAAVDALAD